MGPTIFENQKTHCFLEMTIEGTREYIHIIISEGPGLVKYKIQSNVIPLIDFLRLQVTRNN